MVWDEKDQDREQFTFLQALTALRTGESELITYGDR